MMTGIECYMHDGANWQAQGVLAYLRNQRDYILEETWDKEKCRYSTDVRVGRYENLGEQGYVFSITMYYGEGYWAGCWQRNYAVYEHRNGDQLCVVAFNGVTVDTPTKQDVLEAMDYDKYGYTKDFSCGRIVGCGDYIVADMRKFIHDSIIAAKREAGEKIEEIKE